MKFDIFKPLVLCGTGKRAIQEDCVFPSVGEATIHDKFFLVSDGIGGDGSGYAASECLCKVLPDYFFQNTCPDEPFAREMLDESLGLAHKEMQKQCPNSDGAAFAFLYLHRHGCTAAHIGRTRIYHIRPRTKEVLYRSIDNPAAFSPQEAGTPVVAHITDVKYGDCFLLLSSGACTVLSDQDVVDCVCGGGDDRQLMQRLTKALIDCEENFSAYLVHVSGVMNEALDEKLVGNVGQLMQQYKPEKPASEPKDKTEVAKAATVATAATAAATTASASPKSTVTKPVGTENPQKTPQRRTVAPRNEDIDKPEYSSKDKEESKGFPVVMVTALVIVALAVIGWLWMRHAASSGTPEEETPAVEVKKDSAKRDTMNIMKNEKAKPLQLDEDKAKEKEKEKEKEQAKSKSEEQTTTATDTTRTAPIRIANEPAPATETTVPAPPVSEPKPKAEPEPTPQQPAQSTTPTTVTPRPVIPDGE